MHKRKMVIDKTGYSNIEHHLNSLLIGIKRQAFIIASLTLPPQFADCHFLRFYVEK